MFKSKPIKFNVQISNVGVHPKGISDGQDTPTYNNPSSEKL